MTLRWVEAKPGVPPLLLRYVDAWTVLGYSRSQFFAEVRAGRIPVLRTPSGPRVAVADLEAYVERLKAEAAAAAAEAESSS